MRNSSKFSRLLYEYVSYGKFTLQEPLFYYHKLGTIVVPSGFPTDLDSVPRLPVVYMFFKGRAVKSAAIHDFLYRDQRGKSFADRIFLDAMKDEGVPAYLRYPIYWGVVLGGHRGYNGYK